MAENDFDPKEYWERRFADGLELRAAGYEALGENFNRWLYRVRRRIFLKTIRRLFPRRSVGSVLDLGSGTGFYIERWQELGAASITGSDLASNVVSELRLRYPSCQFIELDIGSGDAHAAAQQFDVVSGMDMLFHVVDDAAYEHAFKSVFTALKPRGYFVFTELLLHGDRLESSYQVGRSLDDVERAARGAGFEIVDRRPVFFFMNPPVDSTSRLLERWWNRLFSWVSSSERLGFLLGALLYPLELATVSLLKEGPSIELMVCRKPQSSRPKEGPPGPTPTNASRETP